MMYKELKQFGAVKVNVSLAKYLTMKVGGIAQCIVIVEELDKLIDLLTYLEGTDIQPLLIGGGSNMILSDDEFEGVAIIVKVANCEIEGDRVIADAGCSTVEVARKSFAAGLTGFEWGVGVPGTIGGAVRGNAGAMGGDMSQSIEKVLVYQDGETKELSGKDCAFAYRDSLFKHDSSIILRVWLQLQKTEAKDGMKKALEHIQYRNKTQPQGYASSGCIFKNISIEGEKEGVPKEFIEKGIIPAGWLIEQVGLKGKQIGNAQISEKHGNFIVNVGGACAQDIFDLIDEAKEKVFEQFGFKLEEEIRIVR
ncbi:UDP-N-acetylmuramate dehydrogenase [Patescibacteria group bacterium]|nr:UDP-N-acetylmuramate dehydrogenase [Patescibacteria group bacterium]MBU1721775.1 UDP-N-acetylmuramate dehydrogenase [Patescibacteria group bacterium]MBU1901386.1 UDP-N-acetylmuramate dehydrogenase [Patescibacteria group bacterium]